MNEVQNRTVVDSDSLHDVSTTCVLVLFRFFLVKVSCITSVDCIGDGKRIFFLFSVTADVPN